MNAQHTPTPWSIVNAPAGSGYHGRIYGRGASVCDVNAQPSGIDSQNAALIVSAVNAHDALTARVAELEAALKDALVAIRNAIEVWDDKTRKPPQYRDLVAAEASISHANRASANTWRAALAKEA